MSLFFSGKRVQNEINSDFANRMKIQGINFLNVPNLSFKREQSESCFDSAERVINQKQNVPNLRFPEFTGEYEKYNLGELGSTLIGLTYSPADVVSEGGTIVLRSSNIKNGVTNYDDIVRVNKKIKDSIITRTNDILVCARNGSPRLIGKNAILKESDSNITFGAFMMIYRSNDNTYIHQLLSTKRFYSQVGENLGARINQITTSDFNSFEFYFPKSKEERIKIASLLALIDKRIETQNKIIQQLQSLIKGICNNLLYADKGKSIRLGDILIERKEKSIINNQYEILSSTVKGVFSQRDYFSKDIASENNIGYKIIRLNDIVLSPQNLWMGNINFNDKYEIGIVSPSYKIFAIKENFNKIYIANLLKTHRALYNYMQVSEQGASIVRRNLNLEAFEQLSFKIPDYQEQCRIARILISTQQKIQLETSLLNKYEEQKKFLLSNMFI